MNYVILNGKNSTSIRGLLIQSLPPVSKPLMRTQIEEIDGRDGDIVTKLGYSAYDKQITIGLHGDFDVDAVIAYFNSEGIVTFSNEPDKYYRYQIIDQIDFERLIRFRTATVTFHVQPFKFSTVDETIDVSLYQSISFDSFILTKNGITVSAEDGVISISGTGTAATEIYMPINTVSLNAGDYTLNAYASGSNPSACAFRLIYDSPSSANSFGGTYATLQADENVTISASLSEAKLYNYLYFYITAGTAMDFTVEMGLKDDNQTSVTVTNSGNTVSKPRITLYGSGTIALSLNGEQIFTINLADEGHITIDSAQMEASKDGIPKNRLVTGDYDNFVLNIGSNTISWSGSVSQISIENYSRWI